MSKKTLALAAVAGLALAGYASAASSGLLPESVDMGLGAQARCQRADANADGEPLARCQGRIRHGMGPGARDRGERHDPLLAPFRVDNETGLVEGRWVRFTVDGEAGALRDYTSKGPFADAVVFDAVTVSPTSDEDGMRARGPLWVGREGSLIAASFNAPNAFLAVRNLGDETVRVTFDLADGIGAAEGERGINLTNGEHRAAILALGNATLALDGETVTATLGEGDVVAFAIEGYPRLLHHELKVLRHLGQDAGERRERPSPGPAGEAAVDLEA